MISLKSLLKNMKEAKITAPKKGVETPLDAKVQIPGFGVMTRKQMQGRKKIGQGYKFASDTFAGALSSAEISKEKGLEAWETGAATEMDKLLNTIMDS